MPDRYLGQTLGKYRVTRLLGAGAYAWVYEAIDQDLDIPVALKILRPEFAGQNDSDVRFRREAATAARLRHRNIVTVRDVGQIDHTAFVVMDWYPLTLGRRLVAAGRLPESECVRIGLDVAAALAIAHAGGVVHRDIKPDNILISREGDAVVADFGLARALTGALAGATALSATNRILGTPHYFSPEQARGHEVDGRNDRCNRRNRNRFAGRRNRNLGCERCHYQWHSNSKRIIYLHCNDYRWLSSGDNNGYNYS